MKLSPSALRICGHKREIACGVILYKIQIMGSQGIDSRGARVPKLGAVRCRIAQLSVHKLPSETPLALDKRVVEAAPAAGETYPMSSSRRSSDQSLDSLSVKLGNWFEAHATGRGVIAVPIVVLIVTAAVAVKILFFH